MKVHAPTLFFAILNCLPALIPVQAKQDKPNFVVILVDDMGWTGLSGYGSDLHQTPNIDQLARDGMKFTDAYASASVCTPTRAALMTGKFPARLHMTIWHEASREPPTNRPLLPPIVEGNLPHAEVTIAEILREAGYRTGHVGKWHLGEASHYPETQGFDFAFGASFWGAPATFYFPYRGIWGSGQNAHPRYLPGIDAAENKKDEYLTDRLTDEALGFIDKAAGKPFFLYMAYHTVHTPIEGKSEVAKKYESRIHEGMEHDNAHYAAMHESLDDNVGRILKKLKQRKIADDTVVILSSDNGGFINNYQNQRVTSNAPLRSGKGALYEGGIRVPLIIKVPGMTRAGTVSHEPVHTADFLPTMMDLAGIDAASIGPIDGVSLKPILKDANRSLDRDTIYWHYPHYYATTSPVSALRQGKWKFLEFFEDGHLELYDLEKDLGETRNLADSMPQLRDELYAKLKAWQKDVDAQMPVKNKNFKR